jgi:hypothetical protein
MTEEVQDSANVKDNINSKPKKSSLITSLTLLSGLSNLGTDKDRKRGISVLCASIMYTISVLTAFIFSVFESKDYIYVNLKFELDSHIINEFKTDKKFLFVIVWLIILNNLFFMFSYFYNYREEDLISDISKNIGFNYVLSILLLSVSTILGIVLLEFRLTNLIINSLIHSVSIGN